MLINIFLLLLVAFFVLLERKFLGLAQKRKGPNIVRFFRLIQAIIDRVKLLYKNFIFINKNDYLLFFFSPLFNFLLSLLNFFFLYIIYSKSNTQYRLLLNLFIRGVLVYTIIRSRWRSNNSYSLIGAIRAVAQIISYEVVLSFFILIFFLNFNNISWIRFLHLNYFFFSFFFLFWFIRVILFSAELNRTPFDLVEGESELIRGYNVEFSRFRFTFLFLREYLSIIFYSFLFCLIFFRKLKIFFVFLLIFIFILIRSFLPRFKFFDLIKIMWLFFLPIITFFYIFFLF